MRPPLSYGEARRLAATLAHLRPVQVVDRALRPARRLLAARALVGPHRLRPRAPVASAYVHARGDPAHGLTCRGETRQLAGGERWDPPGAPRLWTYHLQYLHYVARMSPTEGRALLLDWVRGNPPGVGPGWEPYPLTMRIREWIELLLAGLPGDSEDARALVESLGRQVESLRLQLEYHLLGNHLLENAITLCWAGVSLEGPRADAWRRQGAALLDHELDAQVLADGTHAERSPMYQALLVDALLRLERVSGSYADRCSRQVASRAGAAARHMLRNLASLTHPDGDYALVNDTALGVAPRPADFARAFGAGMAEAPCDDAVHLEQGGFLTWRGSAERWLVFDVGGIGPDHQPGHGHAGALGFELSHGGERLVTDSGVVTYEQGPEREGDRATAAHSTVELDGRNQSDVWASFRCGERIRPLRSHLRKDGAIWSLEGGYRGRDAQRRRVVHRRRLAVQRTRIEGLDAIGCAGAHRATTRLHIAPGVEAERTADGVMLRRGGRAVARVRGDGFTWSVGSSPYHPTFGARAERTCLHATLSFQSRLRLRWAIDLLT